MDMRLRGRSALITGGSKGIGFCIASLLADEGCHVHLVARSERDLDDARNRIHERADVQVHRQEDADLLRAGCCRACGEAAVLASSARSGARR